MRHLKSVQASLTYILESVDARISFEGTPSRVFLRKSVNLISKTHKKIDL